MPKEDNKPWYARRDFLRLRKEWYDKLEKSGFEDVEHTSWDTGEAGMQFKGGGFRSAGDVQRRFSWSKVRYYQLAAQRVWTMREEGCWDAEEIEIFDLHAQGATQKEIWEALGCSKRRIRETIKQQKELFRDYEGIQETE